MNTKLLMISFVFAILIIVTISILVKKEKIDIKYAITWILLFGILALLLIIPNLLNNITKILGFKLSSNMIFAILIGVLIIINISTTKIVSNQEKKIRNLIQELSIVKSNNRSMGNKKSEKLKY